MGSQCRRRVVVVLINSSALRCVERVILHSSSNMLRRQLTDFHAACRRAGLQDLHFHDLRHTFVTRKVREGWDYKRIMAITGHKTFATFQRYNNPSEEDLKAVVANGAAPSRPVGKLLANGFLTQTEAVLSA